MVDLNKIAEKLKKQKTMGVTREGKLTESNPYNKGEKAAEGSATTLEPKRFFI